MMPFCAAKDANCQCLMSSVEKNSSPNIVMLSNSQFITWYHLGNSSLVEADLHKRKPQVTISATHIANAEKLRRCYRSKFHSSASISGKDSWMSPSRFLKFILGSINYWKVTNQNHWSLTLYYLGQGLATIQPLLHTPSSQCLHTCHV